MIRESDWKLELTQSNTAFSLKEKTHNIKHVFTFDGIIYLLFLVVAVAVVDDDNAVAAVVDDDNAAAAAVVDDDNAAAAVGAANKAAKKAFFTRCSKLSCKNDTNKLYFFYILTFTSLS